jgi:hypothetical protein
LANLSLSRPHQPASRVWWLKGRNASQVNRMDNNYLAFRRNAVRYLSAAPRVMWKNRSGKTTLLTDPKSPQKATVTSGTTSDPYAELKVHTP